jgi:hypothetical protein
MPRGPSRRRPFVETRHSRPLNFDPLRFSLPPKAVTAAERHSLIEKAAYRRAERRNFEPGHELEDWLAAEAEVDQQLVQRR